MDSRKINKNYELTYLIDGEIVLTVKPPFTIEFEVEMANYGASNTASIRIYNLKKESRSVIRKDFIDWDMRNQVILKAGYGDNLSEVINMYVNQAWSVREKVDFISQISCADGGYALINGKVNESFSKGTKLREVILKIAKIAEKERLGITVGAISPSYGTQELKRNTSYSGAWWEILNELTNRGAFIANSKINALTENEYIDQDVYIVNSSSGLLGTPTREQNAINFEMLFEPKITIGSLVKLETITGDEDMNNTVYVVQNLSHRGMISESVAGTVVTEIGCFPGPKLGVKPETN